MNSEDAYSYIGEIQEGEPPSGIDGNNENEADGNERNVQEIVSSDDDGINNENEDENNEN